jgi:Ca2+-binding EF-hand superfamily protein
MSNQEELIRKITALLMTKYGDASMETMRRLFNEYDLDRDDAIDGKELKKLLTDADVGSGLTRGMWVNGINEQVDEDGDAKISWQEFRKVMDRS